MKVAIIYATHFGMSEQAAKHLKKLLKTQSDVISFSYREPIDLSSYDAFVLGGSIRMSILDQDFMIWMRHHQSELLAKPLALFVASGFPEKLDTYLKNIFPPALLEHALTVQHIGGSFDLTGLNFYDRFLLKLMKNQAKKNGKAFPTPHFEHLAEIARLLDDTLQNRERDDLEPAHS